MSHCREERYLGRLDPQLRSDVDNLEDISSRADNDLHRNFDRIVQQAVPLHGDRNKVVIICPADMYGSGRGPGKGGRGFLIPSHWYVTRRS